MTSDWEDEGRRDRGRTGTSGMAVASLVLGLLSFCLTVLAGIPAIILGILGLVAINSSDGRLRGRGLAIAGIVMGGIGCLVVPFFLAALLLPAVQSVRGAAERVQSMNNLRELALALQNYQDMNGRLPPAVLSDGKGLPYSWRVAVLPYMEQHALYEAYHRDQPWDSAANREVLAQMPRPFRRPGQPAGETTHYQVLVGPRTAFEPPRGHALAEFTDGQSYTILLVEAEEPVPWTQPADLPYDPRGPMPRFRLWPNHGFLAAFADGSVSLIPQTTTEATVRALITRNGDEVIPPEQAPKHP